MLIVEATLQRNAPNVHAVREVFIWHKRPRNIAMAIVSGGEVLAVLAVLAVPAVASPVSGTHGTQQYKVVVA